MPIGVGVGLGLPYRGRGAAAAAASTPVDLFAAGEPGVVYDPSDPSTLWLDTAGTSPVTADGDPVARVDDKSGNGNHWLQATATARPLYKTAGGLHWLESDGVDDTLSVAFAISQPWDRVSAIRQISRTSTARIFDADGVVSGTLFQASASPTLKIFSGVTLGDVSTLAVGVDGVITERHNGASSRFAHDNNAYVSGDAGTTATDGLRAFLRANTFSPGEARIYGVVMIGRALTDDEITSTREYMADKAGVTL